MNLDRIDAWLGTAGAHTTRREWMAHAVAPAFEYLQSVYQWTLREFGLLLESIERRQFDAARKRWQALQGRFTKVHARVQTVAAAAEAAAPRDIFNLLGRMSRFFLITDRRDRLGNNEFAVSVSLAEALDDIDARSRDELIQLLGAESLHIQLKWTVLHREFAAAQSERA